MNIYFMQNEKVVSSKFWLVYISHTLSCFVDKYAFIWPARHVVHSVVIYVTSLFSLQPHYSSVIPFGRRHHYFYGNIEKTATHIFSLYDTQN